MSSVFSKVISGEFPGHIVWRDERCAVFSSIAPITDGHMLVVPIDEVDDFTAVEPELLSHLMGVAQIIGAAQKQAFDAPRAALIVAGFEVPHLHVHVLPAWGEDELSFAAANSEASNESLAASAELVREVLRAGGHDQVVGAAT